MNHKKEKLVSFLATFQLLSVFWVFLSGKFDLFHVVLGIISVLIVTIWSGNLLIDKNEGSISGRFKIIGRLFPYFFWHFYQVVIANIQVLYVAFHPKMNDILDPHMTEFDTTLKSDMSQYVFANSITLTPGTVTVRIKEGKFLVHALTQQAAEGVPGIMEKKVAKAFGEIA